MTGASILAWPGRGPSPSAELPGRLDWGIHPIAIDGMNSATGAAARRPHAVGIAIDGAGGGSEGALAHPGRRGSDNTTAPWPPGCARNPTGNLRFPISLSLPILLTFGYTIRGIVSATEACLRSANGLNRVRSNKGLPLLSTGGGDRAGRGPTRTRAEGPGVLPP